MENKQPRASQATSSVFSRISAWLFSRLENGIFGHFFTSYDRDNERLTGKKVRRHREKRTKRTIARTLEGNVLVNVIPKIQSFLFRVSIRDYGIALFTMALLTIGMFFAQDYISIISISLASFIAGIVIGVFSLPMMISKKPLASLLLNGRLTNAILFRFLGFGDEEYSDAIDSGSHSSPSISLLCGMILAIISYFLGLLWTIAAIVIVYLAYQVLITPEAGILIFILTTPFTDSSIMAVIGLYVTFCYIIKCIVGRRTFKFELMDLWMTVMMATLCIGGFVSFDVSSSVKDLALTLSIMISYFAISNLVRSKEWYKRCIIAICVSCTFASVIGIVQFVLGKLEITWDGFYAFSQIHERVSSTFLSPDAFGLFCVACLPFLLLFVFSGKSASSRVIGLICSAITVAALVLTYSKVAFIGAVAFLILMLIIFHRNTIYPILLVFATGVVLSYALPEQALEAIASIVALPTNTHAYRVMVFDSATTMIFHRPFGVGMGEIAFSNAFNALVGGETIENVGNTYLQIAISNGVLGLIVSICTIIVFFRLCLTYCAKSEKRMRRINALAGFCGAFGLMISGFFGYIFEDKTILTVFCSCIALSFAYIKIERNEMGASRMVSVDVLSASIDVELERDTSHTSVPKRKYVHTPRKRKRTSTSVDALGIKENEIDPVIHRY